MFTLEPKVETIVTHSVVVTLDETEIAAILVDPKPFQAQLRGLKRLWNQRKSWTNDGRGHPARNKKAAEKKSAAPKDRRRFKAPLSGSVVCPKCGEKFKRLGRHLASCQGPDPLAGPAARDDA